MRNINELPECPVATTISLVGSKWKLLIIRKYDYPTALNRLARTIQRPCLL